MLLRLISTALSLLIVAYVIPGFQVSGIIAALIAALVFGVVNATLGLLLKIITFPATIVTLGLFWFVINALMLLLAARIVPGFVIAGFAPAFWGAILLAIVNLGIESLLASLKD